MNTLFSTFARKAASIISIFALICATTLSFTSAITLGQASPPTGVITVETAAPYNINDTIFLNGYASTTSTGAAYNHAGNLTFAWQLTTPAGSMSLPAPTAASDRISFVADVAGTFTAQLVVTDTTTFLASSVVQQSFVVAAAGGGGTPTAVITMVTSAPYVQNTIVTANALSSTDSTGTVGGALTAYAWNLITPAGSFSALDNPAAATVNFNPDVVGTYTIGLVVAQGGTSSTSVTQNINVVAAGGGGGGGGAGTPTAVITMVTSAPYVQNTIVTANALSSTDSTGTVGGALSAYSWQLTTPGGSSALDNPAAATVNFNPDVVGTYTLRLVVSEGATLSAPVTQNVLVVAAGGGGGAIPPSPGVPYGMQGGGRCINPAYCNIPWYAKDNMAVQKREGLKGITLEKKVNGKRADTEEAAVSLGRVSTADVTYEVVIGNLTGINVNTIVIEDVFKGGSVVKQSNIRSVSGASYDPANRTFTVNKTLQQGETYTYSYRATLTSKSRNALAYNTAIIKDVVFPAGVYEKSADARNGLSDAAYIQFGSGASFQLDADSTSAVNVYVPTEIYADRTEAVAGDRINYTITVRNNTDEALTGVVVNDNYDESLVAVVNADGAEDNGTDLSFAVGTIEPGETRNFVYTVQVRDDAEYTDTLLVSKVRVYTDQYTDQATASVDIHIAPKYAGFLAGAQKSLPQTGVAALIPVLLSSLGIAFATRKRKNGLTQ